jgi:hypothetical protein
LTVRRLKASSIKTVGHPGREGILTYIEKIAFHLGRRDEIPNQELAALLAKEENHKGIEEIGSFLYDKNTSIQSDCIKVLYEVGYISPRLISKYAATFIDLLDSKRNRMVWGAMIALSTIAEVIPELIWPYRQKIKDLIQTGSVITNVSGVKTLINLSKAGDQYYQGLIDDLLMLQRYCRKVDFAKRAEEMHVVIQSTHRDAFKQLLEDRKPMLSKAAQKRVSKVIKNLDNT